MAITVRKGYESQFDINKMLPGEFAVTTDTHKVYVCMSAGFSKELASVEELQNILGASDEAFQAFQELINAMEEDTVITGLLTDVNNLKSGEYTISFTEAETAENIEPTDTIKIILGKIKKFFSSLGEAATKGVANNDTTTVAGYVADARAVNALGEEVDELNTKIEKNILGVGVDLKSYTNSYYTFPSDGYVYLLLSHVANQYVYADISGVSGSAFPLQVSTGSDGHYGNTSIPVFVRAGMIFKIGMFSDLQYVTAIFLPLV